MIPKIKVLFENSTVLAIDKPSGLLSIPDRYHDDKPSAFGLVLDAYPSARPLHRLDFETSGILLFCLQPDAFGWYSDQFEKRTAIKTYTALVEGQIREEHGRIDEPLFTLETGKVIISKKGKASQTEWSLLQRFRTYSLVEAHPLTGRTHQIRVHFASIGHPVVGDVVYGAKGPLFVSDIKGKKKYKLSKDEEEERPLLGRLALHASGMIIHEFASGHRIVIHSELPKDISATIRQLERWAPA